MYSYIFNVTFFYSALFSNIFFFLILKKLKIRNSLKSIHFSNFLVLTVIPVHIHVQSAGSRVLKGPEHCAFNSKKRQKLKNPVFISTHL